MTVAQLKLAAIRARLNGVWDHPALVVFDPLAGTESDIRHILDAHVEPETAAAVDAELEDA
jgi:hypothetical protein